VVLARAIEYLAFASALAHPTTLLPFETPCQFRPIRTLGLIAGSLYSTQIDAAAGTPPPNTVPVYVDDVLVHVPAGSTVFQACELAGATPPRFCFHERLSVAGNCRMCLVEVEKVPKPVASCAYPLMPNMRIKTNSIMVHKAREGVMEFLLANHPLDCPICDQGGECDLQDQSLEYGSDRSRFREIKRTVEDKDFGPIIKTVMTRCIHCTRCVRFSEEIAGVPTLGATGRGNSMEIGTYIPKVFDSELSGNAIDLCPVGALTSKPYEFKARPWELKSTETIDVMDAVGSNIRVDARGPDVLRVLPRLNEAINEEWIADKTRYAIDGLNRQRLDEPMVRPVGGNFEPATWPQAFDAVKKALASVKPSEIQVIAGDLADAETLVAAKDLFTAMGVTNFGFQDGIDLPVDFRSDYLFNTTIQGIDESDFILLVGTNPRMEAAIINYRIRKANFQQGTPVYGIGPAADLALEATWLGNDYSVLQKVIEKSHSVSAELAKAKRPVVIVGMSAFMGENGPAMKDALAALRGAYPNLAPNSISILHTSASRVAAQDIGFVPSPKADLSVSPKLIYLIGADSDYVKATVEKARAANKNTIVVYQGHNGDIGASLANVILPGAAYTEKTATYVNTEGRAQRTIKATDLKGQAREDWKIIRALAEYLGVNLGYDTVESLHQRMAFVSPTLVKLDEIEAPSIFTPPSKTAPKLKAGPFAKYYDNHYFTNAVARASKTMAKTSAELPVSRNSYLQ